MIDNKPDGHTLQNVSKTITDKSANKSTHGDTFRNYLSRAFTLLFCNFTYLCEKN